MPGTAFKLTVAYDGTGFAGWQRQKNGRTVQDTLEQALGKILGSKVNVVAASRTDSGVHAWGQAAHVKLRSSLPLATLHRALNALLPEDLLIRSIQVAHPKFHARYSAKSKWYRYRIWNRPDRPLFDRRFLLHVREPLDLPAMRQAARTLTGRRDFRAFHSEPGGVSGEASSGRSRSGRPVASTVRTIRSLALRSHQGELRIDVKADGFLYHMVRRIVGTLIEIGKGKAPPAIAPTAPAKGLCLMEVCY